MFFTKKRVAILAIILIFIFSIVMMMLKNRSEIINIYYTTDLHSHFTKNLEANLSKIDKSKSLLIDAGDFTDIQTDDDMQWVTGYKEYGYLENTSARIVEKVGEPETGIPPIIQKMLKYKYDMLVLGNHEFYRSPENLTRLIKNSEKKNLPILSANTFYKSQYIKEKEDKRLTKPYIIKTIKTDRGNIKVGLIGVTTTTINDADELKDGKLIKNNKVLLGQGDQYENKMYMKDIVSETKLIAEDLKNKENPDLIVLVAHTGEQAKKPRHSGNDAVKLAKEVPYIDFVIAGHTHDTIVANKYKGVDGKEVILSQASCHSKALGHAQIKLNKNTSNWKIESIKPQIVKFKTDKKDPEDADFGMGDELSTIRHYKKEDYEKLKKTRPNVQLEFVLISDKKIDIPMKTDNYVIDNIYPTEGQYLYYIRANDFDTYKKLIEKYDITQKIDKQNVGE